MSDMYNDPFGTGGFMPPDAPVQGQEKMLLVIFAIDNTRSMEGAPISAVNHALKETISALKDFNNNNNYNVQVAIMTFTNSAEWTVKATRLTDSFFPDGIQCSPGLTFYSSAYSLLDEALSKNQFMNYPGKRGAPTIVFMTDGKPDDPPDVLQYKLEKLKQNGYFLQSVRSAILFGDAANSDEARRYMAEFTENESHIYYTSSPAEIIDSFKTATIHTIITPQSQTPQPDSDTLGIPGTFPPDPNSSPIPTDPIDPAIPGGGPFPTEPADPAIPGGGPFPTDPAPADPAIPADPGIPTDPFPTDLTDPAIPNGGPFATEPADPAIPGGGSFPTDQVPADQVIPAAPGIPTDPFPTDLTDSAIPSGEPFPTEPADPTIPGGDPFPTNPAPADPVIPADPFAGFGGFPAGLPADNPVQEGKSPFDI